jgi:hypothetical protein
MKIFASDLVPEGRYALVRDGNVVSFGDIVDLASKYMPGDTICVSQAMYDKLKVFMTL